MLCDWLSLAFDVTTDDHRNIVAILGKDRDQGFVIGPDGVVKSEWYSRKTKRSDSHQLTVGLSRNRITIDGSPARLGQENNVFGSMDIHECARRMVRHVGVSAGVILPAYRQWRFTRIDATQNYDCGSIKGVRSALESLSKVAGGHLKASTFSDTVYWNKASDLWSAKAYAKGPHLLYQIRRHKAGASDDEIVLSTSLLRLEVSYKSQLIKRLHWNWDTLTKEVLMSAFQDQLNLLIPPNSCEVSGEQQLLESLVDTFGQKKARALFGTWGMLKVVGLAATQDSMPRATWFRHKAAFAQVGLSLGDIATGTILPFRPKSIIARPVDSWEDLRRAA